MMIRIEFSTILTLIAIALSFCAAAGFNSQKSIGKYVGWLELSLIPPIIGNMIIIGSDDRLRSFIGCHIFLLGMDCVMFSLAFVPHS